MLFQIKSANNLYGGEWQVEAAIKEEGGVLSPQQ
jgi:hypothetical protein